MYGLPKGFDGSFLVGHVLEVVCFAKYQIYLHFDEKITITVVSAFSYKNDLLANVPAQESNLMELIGSSVSSVSGDENGTRSLLFNNGQTLKIYDTSTQYESYAIANGGKEIIV